MFALQTSKNKCAALQDDNGNWIYKLNGLQNLMVNFYKNLYYSSHVIDNDFSTCQYFPAIIEELDPSLLKSDITMEETKLALLPDGFHSVFKS